MEWFKSSGIKIGSELTNKQRNQVVKLLCIWRDMFVERVDDLPATDLVMYTIPTYPHCKAYRAKDPIYAKDELLRSCVERGSSPWVAKTTWVAKKETIIDESGRWPNNATITLNLFWMNWPIRVTDISSQQTLLMVSMQCQFTPRYAYKTAFNTMLGQFYFPMGLTGAPATYADLAFGPIPAPKETFKYFFDDDYGAADTFDQLLQFLHDIYFPRIHWARLTLKPSKSQFFVSNIEPLGMIVGLVGNDVVYGIRANDKKRGKIEAFLIPKCEKEIEAFLYLTTYLNTLIPGRTELARVMKEAVINVYKKGKQKEVIGFEWKQEQQDAFDRMKEAIQHNIVVGGDPRKRYYLSVELYYSSLWQRMMREECSKNLPQRKGTGCPIHIPGVFRRRNTVSGD